MAAPGKFNGPLIPSAETGLDYENPYVGKVLTRVHEVSMGKVQLAFTGGQEYYKLLSLLHDVLCHVVQAFEPEVSMIPVLILVK